MKRTITTLFALLIGISFAFSQTIQRDKVVVEIGTGTWCPYCPGAAMGADDLVANGHDVAIIENHNGDSYTNAASNARNSYYSITGYPTAVFDGGSAYVGGSNTTSLYPQYLTKYNQKIVVPSYYSIDITGSSSGMIDFNVDVTIEMVEPTTPSDLRLHCVVTESEIQENWQGQSHLNFVQRMMLPNHNGIQLDFTSGNIIEQNYTFSLDPTWVTEHCEIVIFLQEHGTRVVQNASKRDMMEFGNLNDYDASMTNISNLPEATCLGMVEPKVMVRNNGNMDMTSLTLKCLVNGTEVESYDWTGSLAFLESAEISLPALNFGVEDENEITIYAENPNGNPDQYPLNDTIHWTIPKAESVPSMINLFMRTDDNPGETSWELKDDMGNVLHSGGPYTEAGLVVQEAFELEDLSCYQFFFYDEGGDGLNAPGFFAIYHGNNNYILQGIGDFGYGLSTDISTDNNTSIEDIIAETEVKVYPNPFSNYTNIAVTTNEVSHIKVNMYNILGELVYQSDEGMLAAGEQIIRVSGEGLQNGVYFVQLQVNEQVITERVTVAR